MSDSRAGDRMFDKRDTAIDQLKAELDALHKPRCDSSSEDEQAMLRDVHLGMFGNGSTKGLMWKVAELSVRVKLMGEAHEQCRYEVEAHMDADRTRLIEADRGILAFAKRYPKVATVAVLLCLLGVSSLTSVLLQERAASKLESTVIQMIAQQTKIPLPVKP